MLKQTTHNHYLITDNEGNKRFVILPKDNNEAELLKPYVESFTDKNGKQHLGLRMTKACSFWLDLKRKCQSKAIIVMAGVGLVVWSGYCCHNLLKTDEIGQLADENTVEISSVNGATSLDISQVYPFAEAERNTSSALNIASPISQATTAAQIPAIPYKQFNIHAPLPGIPVKSGPTVQNTGINKANETAKYQSKIAFIGGDGLNFGKQNNEQK